MGWREEHEEKQRQLQAELNELIDTTEKSVLDKRFLRNFGCINFISGEAQHEFDLAQMYHELWEKWIPEFHDTHEEEPMRCYHVTKCKCGFSWACDSSD